jgi:CRISPR system Cascade subunit CasA
MMNFLDEPLLTAASLGGVKSRYSLPGVLAALVRGDIASFSALRSHQRHVWHAFTVQLAALALEKAQVNLLPDDEPTWRKMLRGLTRMWPDGEPWSLTVQDPEKPALLQAPVPGGGLPQFKTIGTPDGLDILVTSKNHDLKAARMYNAAPEDWLFALVSLQTQQGIMGAGKYGISRMNGGYGSRPVIGTDNPGEAGFRFRQDTLALLSSAEDEINPHGLSREGIALLWLKPWDGTKAIDFRELHPLYIEICRRVRLGVCDGKLFAMDAASKAARISGTEHLKGNTGDPWTPVSSEGKSFTVTCEGFSSRKLADLFSSAKFQLPVCVRFSAEDCESGLSLAAQSVCRGQGKTQGYHERRIFLPPAAVTLFKTCRGTFNEILERRVGASSDIRLALRYGLFVLCQRAPAGGLFDKEATRRFVEPALEQFDISTDRTFFDGLWQEMEAADSSRQAIYQTWLLSLTAHAQRFLAEAPLIVPYPSGRRYWARAQSELAFRAVLLKSSGFHSVLKAPKPKEHARAVC